MPGNFIINGLVNVGGSQFWRIDDLDAGRVGVEFLKKPAALILAEPNDEYTRSRAMLVLEVLNNPGLVPGQLNRELAARLERDQPG